MEARVRAAPSRVADVELQNGLQTPAGPVADSVAGYVHGEVCEGPVCGEETKTLNTFISCFRISNASILAYIRSSHSTG